MKLSLYSGNLLQKYYFGGGQKFMHVSYNEWPLVESGYNTFKQQYNKVKFLNFSLLSAIY